MKIEVFVTAHKSTKSSDPKGNTNQAIYLKIYWIKAMIPNVKTV